MKDVVLLRTTFVVSIHKERKCCKTAVGLIKQQRIVNEEHGTALRQRSLNKKRPRGLRSTPVLFRSLAPKGRPPDERREGEGERGRGGGRERNVLEDMFLRKMINKQQGESVTKREK